MAERTLIAILVGMAALLLLVAALGLVWDASRHRRSPRALFGTRRSRTRAEASARYFNDVNDSSNA